MSCVGDPAVKIQVGLQQRFGRLCMLHALIGFADRGDFIIGGMLGSESGYSRLDNAAHAGQQGKELVLWRTLHQPVQHIGVEHVPFTARLDHGAHPGPGIHQPLGHQHPRGFTQYRAADGIFFAQQGFGGQLVIGFKTSGNNLHAEFLNDARVHAFALGRLTVIHWEQVGPVAGKRRS